MHQDDVVRAFADRMVELDVDFRLVLEIAGAMRLLHARQMRSSSARSSAVARRAAYSAAIALDLAAIFQIVGRRLAMHGDQFGHRLGEHLADDVGDIGAAAMPGRQQAARLQHLQRVAQDRPRHLELPRQLPLAGQPVAARSTPSRIRLSICCTASSAVRECSILEKMSLKGAS